MDSPVTARVSARVPILFVVAVWVASLTPLGAQSSSEATLPFYERLLMRGTIEYESGDYSEAARSLEIASFGLMERLALYQKAQIVLALSEEGRGNFIEARAAIRRVLQVESISPTYPPAGLDPAIRASFEATARRLFPEAELPGDVDDTLPPIEVPDDLRNM